MSRAITDLLPVVQAKANRFLSLASDAGIPLLVTATYRSFQEQDDLYAQGRTKPGAIVTQVRGGQSWHNFRCALDVVPLRNGKPVWGTRGEDAKLWAEVGRIGQFVGLEWGGAWPRFKDFVHFQYLGNPPITIGQAAGGMVPK
jgi:peptidoglycan LD-endopeptidase CwlK